MRSFSTLGKRKVVIGMVHLPPLPGTPYYKEGEFDQILATAVESASALYEGGADGCLIQTVDRVYNIQDESDPARTTAIGLITQAIAQVTSEHFQVGVQLMPNAVKASLAVAKVAGGSFIRASAIVGMTLSIHGMIEANPFDVIEYRNKINADDIKIIADIESMHFQWFGGTKPVNEVAKAAKQVGADAIALGNPDEQKTMTMIEAVRRAVPELPIILAGYTNFENVARLLTGADGAFVGTCLERGGWGGQIDVARVRSYVEIVRSLE